MSADKVVVVATVLDQGDITSDFIEWNLHLGVDLILVQDLGSSDGSHALLEANTHLPPWWGWHWRRWIRLKEAGRLREEYDSQFVTPARRDELIRDGTCTIDKTVANFIKRRNSAARPSLPRRMFARLFGGPD